MKTRVAVLMAVILFVMWSTSMAFAAEEVKAPDQKPPEQKVEEPKVTGSAGVAVLNRYIFRGYQFGQSGVVIQPTLSASYYGFTATFWGNMDTKEKATQNFTPDRPDAMSFNETDLTLSYTYAIDKLSLTGGWIYYGTKYTNETHELFVSATYDVISKPTLSINQDIASYPGTYINLSFSHSLPVYKEVTLDLGASFGWWIGEGSYWKTYEHSTGNYSGSKYSALHDGMVKLGFTIPVTKMFALQPVVQYWFPLSGDAKKWVDGNGYTKNGAVRDSVVFGLGATMNF